MDRELEYGASTVVDHREGSLRNLQAPVKGPDVNDFIRNVQGGVEEMEFPEGGWRAWGVVFGSFCAMIATFGVSSAMGTIQSVLTQNQLKDYSQSDVSWIFSVWMFLCFLGGLQVGPIFDRYGTRVLLIPGSILLTASYMLTSICTKYFHFILAFSVLGGVAMSMIFNPCVAVIGHWFLERRAFATGVASCGGAVGGLIFPLAIDKWIELCGFGWAIRFVGFIIGALCVVACILCKSRHSENTSTQKGLGIDFSGFKSMPYLLVVMATFLCEWACFVPLNFLVVYAMSQGYTETFGNSLLIYESIGSIIGGTVPGYFADVLGSFNILVLTTTLCGLSSLCVWLPAGSSKGGLIAFSVLFGIFSGTTISLIPVCISRISLTKDYGKRYGTCYFVVSIATLTGLPLSGSMTAHNYMGMIIFSGVCYLGGSGLFAIARLINGGRRVMVF